MADDADGTIVPLRSEPDFARPGETESADAVGRRLDRAEEHIRTQLELINAKLDRVIGVIENKFDDYDDRFSQVERRKTAARKK